MTGYPRLERYEGLLSLLRHLAGPDFGSSPACGADGVDPELFHPVSEQDRSRIDQAKAICAGCPVASSCLEHALRSGDHGIWGGTTETERRRIKAVRKQKHHNGETSEGVQAA